MCKYLQPEYVLNASFFVSGGKLFDSDSEIREGIVCEVGELVLNFELWCITPHDLVTRLNYRECSGVVRTADGDIIPIKGGGDILFRFLSNSVRSV